MVQRLENLTSIHRLRVQSLALLSGLRSGVAVNCGIGHRRSLDPVLLWLWHRLVTTALTGLLAWEPPYTAGAALKRQKDKKKIKIKIKKIKSSYFHLIITN